MSASIDDGVDNTETDNEALSLTGHEPEDISSASSSISTPC